jgi:diadenosine tetraphosphate (Ap4A) HIT family hydrolase
MKMHESVRDCPLCGVDADYDKSFGVQKRRVFDTKNFFGVVRIWPLNKTHLMVCPKTHKLAFSELSDRELFEAKSILNYINHYNLFADNDSRDGKTEWFEHGSSACSISGGCISHAHIHGIVPERKKLFHRALEKFDFKDIKFSEINKIKSDDGYLLHIDDAGQPRVAFPTAYTSQYWCQLYADGREWNWKRQVYEGDVAEQFARERDAIGYYEGLAKYAVGFDENGQMVKLFNDLKLAHYPENSVEQIRAAGRRWEERMRQNPNSVEPIVK